MGYIQGANRNQVVLLPETLDDYVSAENEVRVIDAFIDGLDIETMGFKAEAAREGRPGYDPRDMLKLYMYGYSNHIRSSRRLQKEAARNVEVMWLLKKIVPDFRCIADFRKDNAKAIKEVFRAFVKLCNGAGLLEDLRIVDDVTFEKCIQLVKGRACTPAHSPDGVVHTDSRSLLSGLLYCADCGTRLYFSHNVTTKKMADGTKRKYERDMYRCYRKLSSRKTCRGPSAYNAERLNDVVDTEIRKHLARLGSISEEDLLKAACSQNADLYEVAYRQAEEEFQKVSRQVVALEEETVKALTGESQLDLSVVNGMLLKHRAKLEECQWTMEEAKAKKEAEAENTKAAKAQVKEMLTWVERYDKASVEAKHMIIAALVDRIEIGENYEVHIQFKVSAEQFIRQTA